MIGEVRRHSNYYISDDGTVYRKTKRGLSELIPDISNGYPRVDLDGRKEYVGRLVLETFCPCEDLSLKVFYIDGNPLNTNLRNLVWLSSSDVQLYSTYTMEYRLAALG